MEGTEYAKEREKKTGLRQELIHIRLKDTKIIERRKTVNRRDIPKFGSTRKETVCIEDILETRHQHSIKMSPLRKQS